MATPAIAPVLVTRSTSTKGTRVIEPVLVCSGRVIGTNTARAFSVAMVEVMLRAFRVG